MLLKCFIVWSVNWNCLRKEMFNVLFFVFFLVVCLFFFFVCVCVIDFLFLLWGGRGASRYEPVQFLSIIKLKVSK